MALSRITDTYGSYWRGNEYGISESQKKENAQYIWNYLGSRGWSLQAVAGILGNTDFESGHNPAIWQNLEQVAANGYGIVQWTPSAKLTEWAAERGYDNRDLWVQLERVDYERINNIQWSTDFDKFPISFERYWNTQSHSAYWCGGAWFTNYERGATPEVLPYRMMQAREWAYYLFTLPKPTQKRTTKWIYYMKGHDVNG